MGSSLADFLAWKNRDIPVSPLQSPDKEILAMDLSWERTNPPVENVDFVNTLEALLEQLFTLRKIVHIHIVLVLELIGFDLAGVLVVLETLDVDRELRFSAARIFNGFDEVVECNGRRFLTGRRVVGVEDFDRLFLGEEVLPLEVGETGLNRSGLGDGCCGHAGLIVIDGRNVFRIRAKVWAAGKNLLHSIRSGEVSFTRATMERAQPF